MLRKYIRGSYNSFCVKERVRQKYSENYLDAGIKSVEYHAPAADGESEPNY